MRHASCEKRGKANKVLAWEIKETAYNPIFSITPYMFLQSHDLSEINETFSTSCLNLCESVHSVRKNSMNKCFSLIIGTDVNITKSQNKKHKKIT